MRVAFLAASYDAYTSSFAPLVERLLCMGHDVGAFYPKDQPLAGPPEVQTFGCDWWLFDLDALEKFKPDRVVVFNGSFYWCHGVLQHLQQTYKIVYLEQGWLPQAHNRYVDLVGVGNSSSLAAMGPPAAQPNQDKLLQQLHGTYGTLVKPTRNPGLPEGDFILVPLQLSYDTSIHYGSPYFKDMPSLVGFIASRFTDMPIVVAPHPLDPTDYGFKNVIMSPARFIEVVPFARAVVGINSTTLIESLVFRKPVASLGYSVASNKGVFLEPQETYKDPRKVLAFKPDVEKVENCLALLYASQYHVLNPGRRVLNRILDYK